MRSPIGAVLEQPQKLGLDFHGHPCMAQAGRTVTAGPPRLTFRQFFAYPGRHVYHLPGTFTDGGDVTHSVTVSASSLYEAGVLGVVEFKRNGFASANIGPATRLMISVEPPATTRELAVGSCRLGWVRTAKHRASKRRR